MRSPIVLARWCCCYCSRDPCFVSCCDVALLAGIVVLYLVACNAGERSTVCYGLLCCVCHVMHCATFQRPLPGAPSVRLPEAHP